MWVQRYTFFTNMQSSFLYFSRSRPIQKKFSPNRTPSCSIFRPPLSLFQKTFLGNFKIFSYLAKVVIYEKIFLATRSTSADKINAISTALGAIGFAAAFISGGVVVSGIFGVASCIVGLASNFVTHVVVPTLLRITFDDGTHFSMIIMPSGILC